MSSALPKSSIVSYTVVKCPMKPSLLSLLVSSLFLAFLECAIALQTTNRQSPPLLVYRSPFAPSSDVVVSRRSTLFVPASIVAIVATTATTPVVSSAAVSNGLPLTTSSSGLKWADAKVGSGQPIKKGARASIDYSMASTAGRFPQIYTTKDKGTPYRWTLGDGTTIEGIEKAIIGDDDIPPMLPGGIRRVIVPSALGYASLAVANSKCIEGGAVGPIPPKDADGAYQRWVQFYCNPRIPYQPDLVLDIKLYGKRDYNN